MAAGLALLAVHCGSPASARAMSFTTAPTAGGGTALLLQGRILPDDPAKLAAALRRVRPDAVLLNSPGGGVIAARDMARMLQQAQVPVEVPARAVCASACFLLFAAGRDKLVEPGAMIGVHSASVSGGNETMDTLGVTTLMAREAARYGVPPPITGRMVTTAPGQMAWLDPGELASMGARVGAGVADPGGGLLPGSASGRASDWTRGFQQGQAGAGGCAAPEGIADPVDFALGCASGRRALTARVPPEGQGGAVPLGGSDWTRGFAYGRRAGRDATCDPLGEAVGNRRDWSLGCASGRRASAGGG